MLNKKLIKEQCLLALLSSETSHGNIKAPGSLTNLGKSEGSPNSKLTAIFQTQLKQSR